MMKEPVLWELHQSNLQVFGRMLKRANIRHTVLNAAHEREAEIVAQADNPGGYHRDQHGWSGYRHQIGRRRQGIGWASRFGYEHESRRIDRQLRGMLGRRPGRPSFMSRWRMTHAIVRQSRALSKMLEKSFGEDESLEHGTLDWSI